MLAFSCCPNFYGHKGAAPHYPPRMEMMHHGHHHAFNGDIDKAHVKEGFKHHYGFDGRRPEPTPEMKAKFAEKLGLTDEQKTKLEQMRQEDMAKMEPLFKQMESLHEEMEKLRQDNRHHFESVLTDAQKEILQTMRKEFKQKHHH